MRRLRLSPSNIDAYTKLLVHASLFRIDDAMLEATPRGVVIIAPAPVLPRTSTLEHSRLEAALNMDSRASM